jgi:hypothetical protein
MSGASTLLRKNNIERLFSGFVSKDLHPSTTRVAVGGNDLVGSTRLTPGMYLRISVADTGCGMSQDFLGRVFEPYFTTKGAGTRGGSRNRITAQKRHPGRK